MENITDMIDTMRYYHGVGLAAPQIGIPKRILVLEVNNNVRYPLAGAIELDVLINPEITEFSKETDAGWEGCLSVPGLRGKINRASQITFEAYNDKGEFYSSSVEGFHARIIQHELDHLNGILFPQRLDDFQLFGFEDSLPDYQ